MAKYFETSAVFNFTWEQVVQGFWKRYPNPQSTHVLTEDTVWREVQGHKLFSKRLLTKTNHLPKWGERFVATNSLKVVEESILDLDKKTLTTYTRNLGYTKVMTVVEKVIYRVNEKNQSTTIAERSALIDSQVFGFGRAIKAFGVERFKKNCIKMVNGFEYVLNNLFPNNNQGQTFINSNNPPQISSQQQTTTSKLVDAAKSASNLAKSKTQPILAS